MLLNLRSILCAIVLFASLSGAAQENMSGQFKKRLFDADILFDQGEYLRAGTIYDSLWDSNPSSSYLQYKTGVCLVFKSNSRAQAYDILKDLRGSKDYPRATFYMARAKHYDYHFDEAIDLFNEYLTTSKASGAERIETLKLIINCENGIDIMERQLALTLEILTPPSNKKNSQYSPVISPDEKHLYYTSRGPDSKGDLMTDQTKRSDVGTYYEDVFVAENIGNDDRAKFTEGEGISDAINQGQRHEAPMSVSYDNQMMFIYLSGEKASEDIYVSYNQGDTNWTRPKKLEGGVNTPQYEGHAFLAPNGRTLYFSSDKPGGYGGRDLYTATMKEDSTFGNITNLGPKINTEFNEDSPFLYSNGSSLYFASEAHGSMGGYDMFYIKFDSTENDWQEAINMGYPINTTDDDRFYYITKDGDWGYFSSARASGENLHDIYRIQPGTFERLNSLVLLVGTVYIDTVRSSALAKIMDDKTGDVLATLVADSTTGEFVYSLLPGHKYKISLLADGFSPKIEYVDVPPMKEGVLRIEHRFDFYTPEWLALHADTGGIDLQSELDGSLDGIMADESVCDVEPDREELTAEEIESGCYFRVQVGAYRNPGRFQYDFLRSVGEVEIRGYSDGITRFLMGPKFTKRSEADKLRMECIAAGEWDSWITVRR